MSEQRSTTNVPFEDVIAAFDRERAEAHELRRRHLEQLRAAGANDRPVGNRSKVRSSR